MLANQLAAISARAKPMLVPSTPAQKMKADNPLSPVPSVKMELHACLEAFFHLKDINIRGTEPLLEDLELTPDIIAEVPVNHLVEVMGIKEGQVQKFQSFC